VRIGNPVDIQLVTNVPPVATTSVTMIGNLNSTDKSSFYYPTTNDWEGLGFAGAWDGQTNPPIDTDNYSYSDGTTIYDEAGNAHDVMVYYQKNPHMENVWDYIVTCDPEEDARMGADGSPMFDSKSQLAGLLQKGKLTFNPDGQLVDIEADNFDIGGSQLASTDAPSFTGSAVSQAMQTASIGGYYKGSGGTDPATGQSVASARNYTLSWGWQDPAGEWKANNESMKPPMSGMTWTDDQGNSGFFLVDKKYPGPYNFGSGLTVTFEASSASTSGTAILDFGQPGQDAMQITAHSEEAVWSPAATDADGNFSFDLSFTRTPVNKLNPPYDNVETVSQSVGLYMGAKKPYGVGDIQNDAVSMTQYGSKSNTIKADQNGFPDGALERVYVREDGMVMGVYNKKREEALYQITITRFRDTTDLSKKGDNLFMPTRLSGEGFDCVPGEDGAGSVLGNFLEQSTVDTATEIVTMIMTQRGFQANSKSITTSDAMLATAIQTKK
jgi:flagellar hook-basal body protein